MTSPLETLISEVAKSWPAELSTSLTAPSGSSALALSHLLDAARSGEVSTLPYAHAGKELIFWVAFGGDSRRLLEYGEDLKSWVLPGYGATSDLEFARGSGSGRLALLLQDASPAGYLRWTSDIQSLSRTLNVLAQMRQFLSAMPDAGSNLPPSLHVLRFRFVSALRLGEWDVAESIVDQIDRWNLEQAHKTMQMRLRVLGEAGNHKRLLEIVEKHHLWPLQHPNRVATAILHAVEHEVVRPLESRGALEQVLDHLRPWSPKLASVAAQVTETSGAARLLAYLACLDGNSQAAIQLLPQLTDPLAQFVRTRFASKEDSGPPQVLPLAAPVSAMGGQSFDPTDLSEVEPFWSRLQSLVRKGTLLAVAQHLSKLEALANDNPEFLLRASDALLGLISDPTVDAHAASRNGLQDLLTSLIDVAFGAPTFPSYKYMDLYISLAEALIYLRSEGASEEDAHLLHGLLAAIANLSKEGAVRSTDLLRSWWQLRPIPGRLDWLLGVIESLAPLHADPSTMVDLWSAAVALAARRRLVLTPSQFRTWQRVAGLLELDAGPAESDLAPLRPTSEAANSDILSAAGWRKVAIVSLQEGSAREAARELEKRTGAEVTVVNSLVQDGLTKVAQTADIILLVWAACSHAVYRAFDDHRERIAYVQGSGASSILSAAERWAERHAAESPEA